MCRKIEPVSRAVEVTMGVGIRCIGSRSIGALVAALLALLPGSAHAVSDVDDLCLGDPCVIVGTHMIDAFSFLDFAGRAVRLEGVLQIGSRSVSLVAGSLHIAASGSIDGTGVSTPGGVLDIDVDGDVIIEGTLGTGIDLRGAPGGALAIGAGGSIVTTRPIGAAGRVSAPAGGSIALTAGGSIFVDTTLDVRAESSLGMGGTLSVDAGHDVRIASVDATGGSEGAGAVEIRAGRDVRIGPITALGVGIGGPGGEVGIDAFRSIHVGGPIDARGSSSGGDGGAVRLIGDSAGVARGDVEVRSTILVEGRGTATCGGSFEVEGSSIVLAGAVAASGDCGGFVEMFASQALRVDTAAAIDVRAGSGSPGAVMLRSFGSLVVDGSIDADGGSFLGGSGGTVQLDADGAIRVTGILRASTRSSAADGGRVSLDSCDATTTASARLSATGALGGVDAQTAGAASLAGIFAAGEPVRAYYRPGGPAPQLTGGSFSPSIVVATNPTLAPCDYAVCGDRVAEFIEECDDGNALSGDGCSWSCQIERGPCNDGVDDDADGLADFPSDPGCQSIVSPKENPLCDDGLDNDGDGRIDWDGTPPDPECQGAGWRDSEAPKSGCGLGVEMVLALPLLAARHARRPRLRSRLNL